MNNTHSQRISAAWPWIVWLIAAGFFFIEYFARVAPSIMAPELMSAFHVSAVGLGSLSAFFYYPYVFMQIPVGTLVDRYGPHRLLTAAAVVCAGGSMLFAVAHQLWMAELGRFLVGFSSAFAFVGALKLATIWFDAGRLGLLVGLTQGLGMLGACVGEAAFSVMVANVGWRHSMMVIAVLLLGIGLAIWAVVRDHRPGQATMISKEQNKLSKRRWIDTFEGLFEVLRDRPSWLNALYAGLIYAPTAAFAELWGVSFLQSAYGLDPHIAALAIGMVFIGLAMGCPLIGWISDRCGRRKPLLMISALLALVLLVIILYCPGLPVSLLFASLFCYGIVNSGVALSYAVAGELQSRKHAGVAIAFANMASILVGGAMLQTFVGWLLDWHWSGVTSDLGVRIYSATDFYHALIVLPLCLVLALVIAFFGRETFCRSQEVA